MTGRCATYGVTPSSLALRCKKPLSDVLVRFIPFEEVFETLEACVRGARPGAIRTVLLPHRGA
jgi:hypothetical protein